MKKADTPTPIMELKKNFVVISVSEKANNKLIMFLNKFNLLFKLFVRLLFVTSVISNFTYEGIQKFSAKVIYLIFCK